MGERRRRSGVDRLALILLALLLAPVPAAGQESAKGYIEMPVAPDGAWVLTHPPGSGRGWGTPTFVRYLALVAREWRRRHPDGPVLRIGDMSKPDGTDFPPHKTHKDGLTADIFTSPRNVCHIDFPDQDLTVELAKLMHDLGARQILYNGKKVIDAVPVAEKWPQHDDHFHVVIDPSRVPAEGEVLVLPEGGLATGSTVGAGRGLQPDGTGLELRWRVLGQLRLRQRKVQLDDLDDQNGVLHDPPPSRSTESAHQVDVALEHGKEYRWRVELTPADGKPIELPWQRIKVDIRAPRVEALTPQDEAELDAPPLFSWRWDKPGTPQATWRIEIDTDRNHKKVSGALGPFQGTVTRHALGADTPLRAEKKYWWRVVAADAHGNEGASEWRSFETVHAYESTRPAAEGGGGGGGGSEARAVVKASELNLRAGPGTDAKVLATLPRGTELKILSAVPGWLEVEAEHQGKPVRGFVSAEYVDRK